MQLAVPIIQLVAAVGVLPFCIGHQLLTIGPYSPLPAAVAALIRVMPLLVALIVN